MATETTKDRRVQLLGVVIFGGISLVALGVFFTGVASLFNALFESASVITFNSGIFKLLGVAIGLGALAIYTAIQWRLKRIPSNKVTKLITGSMVVGVALLFLLPHFVHIPLERHLFNRGYKLCEPKSRNNFSYKTVVYVNNVPICFHGLEQYPLRR